MKQAISWGKKRQTRLRQMPADKRLIKLCFLFGQSNKETLFSPESSHYHWHWVLKSCKFELFRQKQNIGPEEVIVCLLRASAHWTEARHRIGECKVRM